MALGLNIVVGFAGLLDLGYVAFFAIGAHVAAHFGSAFWANADVSLLVDDAGLPRHPPQLPADPRARGRSPTRSRASLIGVPTLRLRGDYVGIVTLAFGEIIGQLVANGQDIHFLGGIAHRRAERHVRRSTGSTSRSSTASARSTCALGTGSRSRWSRSMLVVNFRLRDSRARPRVARAARRRGGGGEHGRPDRAHEAARLRRRRRARRRGRRLPRLVPELRRTRTSSRSRSRSSSSPWSCSAGWARSGASSSARSSCR